MRRIAWRTRPNGAEGAAVSRWWRKGFTNARRDERRCLSREQKKRRAQKPRCERNAVQSIRGIRSCFSKSQLVEKVRGIMRFRSVGKEHREHEIVVVGTTRCSVSSRRDAASRWAPGCVVEIARKRMSRRETRGGYARGDNAIPVPARKPAFVGFLRTLGPSAIILFNDFRKLTLQE